MGNRLGEILDTVAIHLDATVGEEELGAVPLAGDVAELLAEAGLGRDAGALLLQPFAEVFNKGSGAQLPFGETPLRRAAADIGLDGIELGDPAQALGCDLGAAAVVDFAKSAPGVGLTVRWPQQRAALAARCQATPIFSL